MIAGTTEMGLRSAEIHGLGSVLLENLFLVFVNVLFLFLNCMYTSLSEYGFACMSTVPAEARR